jgi:hypothetical protein
LITSILRAGEYSFDVWLRAAVVLPGNTKVVHHSLVSLAELRVLLQGAGLAGRLPDTFRG